jgi:hypothetical protein
MNGEGGHSWGGFGIGQPGSGLTHVRVVSPKQLADSSGGNELITAVLALKEVIAERIGQAELGTLGPRPTNLHLDASVVLDGVAMDRVSRESRYLAAKLSMLRSASANGVINLAKIPTQENPADIFTKPLVGAALAHARGLVLGHAPAASVLATHDFLDPRTRVKAAKKRRAQAAQVAAASAASAKPPGMPAGAAAQAKPPRGAGSAGTGGADSAHTGGQTSPAHKTRTAASATKGKAAAPARTARP